MRRSRLTNWRGCRVEANAVAATAAGQLTGQHQDGAGVFLAIHIVHEVIAEHGYRAVEAELVPTRKNTAAVVHAVAA